MSATQQRTAAATDTGRACPYCRFPLKEGVAVCECGACHSVHHDDCWADNGGCAIVGCSGGDSPAAQAPVAAPAASQPLPAVPASTPIAVTAAEAPLPKASPPPQKGP